MPALLLAGVAVSAFFSSLISAIVVLEKDTNSVREILFWLAGGLDSRSWEHAITAGPLIILGAILIMFYSRDLNLLNLNDDDAKAMGINVNVTRPFLIILCSVSYICAKTLWRLSWSPKIERTARPAWAGWKRLTPTSLTICRSQRSLRSKDSILDLGVRGGT